jgi:hypothetical protein
MVAGNLKPAACNIASGTLIPSTLQAVYILFAKCRNLMACSTESQNIREINGILDVTWKTDKYLRNLTEHLTLLSIFHYLPSACNWLLIVLRKAISLLFEKVACVVCLLHVTPFKICNTAGRT